jgi:hypothetical protein
VAALRRGVPLQPATLELMAACGFRLDAHPAAWRAMPPIIRPLVVGRATIGAGSAVQTTRHSRPGSCVLEVTNPDARGLERLGGVSGVRVGTFLPLGQPRPGGGCLVLR